MRLREWCLRVWGTFAHRRDDVEEELRFHLEMAEKAALRRGEPSARRECGLAASRRRPKPCVIRARLVREGLAMALIGVAIGVALALALTRVLASFLFGVGTRDTATFVSVSLTLVASACLASYIPARRATRIDPICALRHE